MSTRSMFVAIATCAACGSSPQSVTPATPPPAPPPVATPTPAPAPAPTPPTLRLTSKIHPTRYAVDLTVVPSSEAFQGKVVISIQLAEPSTVIWVHAAELTVASATITANNAKVAARTLLPPSTPAEPNELLGIVLDKPIGPGAAELAIEYTGKLSAKDSDGLYREEEHGEWYAFTQFEATDARRAFPCFDEPSFKAPFQITLHVKTEHVAVSNAPVASESPEPNGMKAVRFAETKPLPSYLVALAVGPFEIVDGGKAGKNQTPLRIIVPKGRAAEAAYATRATPELVTRLEDYFGMPYPYEKLDQIAVPRKGGAMENAGLITYGLPLLLIAPDEETISRKRRFALVGAHEIGHHWFGDLVTLGWWNDIWLNESFASWVEYNIVGGWLPKWSLDVSVVQSRSNAMSGDALTTARKIRQPIESRHDIQAAFDGITYGKGGAVIAMFEAWIGRDKFQKAIHNYLTKHAHGVATTADFLAALSAEAGSDIAPIFSTFLDQPGVPLVTAELVCAKDQPPKLVVSQQRYQSIGSTAGAQTWKIPMCIKFGSDKVEGRQCTVLAEPKAEIALEAKNCPRWVLANEGELGYYRVHYAGDMMDRLLAATKQLTVAERVGLLGDLSALVKSGAVPVGKALERVPGLAKDPNRHLASQASDLIGYLGDEVVAKELRPNRARFVRKVFGAKARAYGWKPAKTEDDDKRLLRPTLLFSVAYTGEDPALIAEAKKLADKWLTDKKAIAADLVGTALRIAARNGDRAFFDRLRAAAKVEKEYKERNQMIDAMGGFRDPEIVKAALAITLTDELETRESIGLIWGALADDDTRELAWTFVKQNVDVLIAKLPRDWGAAFISIGGAFCDEAHRTDVATFFKDKAAGYLGGPRRLAQTLERMDLCIARKQVYEPSIAAFLKKQ